MSTQQLVDGNPWDDPYFDLRKRSLTGPPAPAWDPEKMELRRIVDRLLEERRYLPPRQVELAVPHTVKLPPFWEKDAAAWFKLVEAILEDSCMRDPWAMYRTVLLHIPHHVLERGPEPG